MRSPSSAPPVRRFEGSTESTATVLVVYAARNRRTSSSTSDDFPAPPVPVMPSTGAWDASARVFTSSYMARNVVGWFSAALMTRAVIVGVSVDNGATVVGSIDGNASAIVLVIMSSTIP
ncbi:hypothetical protein BMS3Bbin02_00888 [bacterium BMS3Bbin02]|nr:hypothetical protein BMS3Bbin02_00888 [bacterium BMS3Bbin02]